MCYLIINCRHLLPALLVSYRPLSRRIPPPVGILPRRRRRRKKFGTLPRQPKFSEAAAISGD